jgi:PAS domain S-box-containing protein
MSGRMKSIEQCRVLVVDDMVENLWVAEDVLQDFCMVTTLEDGSKTLETALSCRPDLILLDVVMPGADGFSICKELKATARTMGIPVIFLTSLSEAEHRIEGFDAGGVDYISKPFFAGELKARVRTHLQVSLLEAELREHVNYLSQALESTEENYLFLARTTTDILLRTNSLGELTLVNPAWTRITGGAVEALTGRPFFELAIPDDATAAAEGFSAAVASRAGEAQIQFRIPAGNGPLWVRATLRLLYDEPGNFLGATGVLTDINDLVEESEGLLISKDGIEEAHVESIENLAHDLRTPLNAIGGGLQMLAAQPIPGEAIGMVRQGFEEMERIISGLLGSPSVPHATESGPNRIIKGFTGPVLLVDDSFINLRLLQHLLKRMSFSEFDLAQSGEQALALWRERRHPLVLLDLKMPEMDGFEVCRTIRSEQGDQAPAIIAVSASLIPENAKRCEDSGFDAQLAKPVNIPMIERALEQLGR